MSIKELRNQTNMTQQEFSDYFNIPVRTLQNWEGGQRRPPEYVVELIKYKIEKEKLGMKTLNILKNKEDGTLTLSYKGIGLEGYEYITVEEFIGIVEEANTWDMIEPEIYSQALKDFDLDYNDYDDPDKMWNDFIVEAKSGIVGNCREVKILERALEVVDEAAKGGNETDKAWQAMNELLDYIEENGGVNKDYVEEVKKQIIKASRYAGYTNLQHNLMDEVNAILSELQK